MNLIPNDGERLTWAERQHLRTVRSLHPQDQRAVFNLAENLVEVSDIRRKTECRPARKAPKLALIPGGHA
jgi:hypothetical protein